MTKNISSNIEGYKIILDNTVKELRLPQKVIDFLSSIEIIIRNKKL